MSHVVVAISREVLDEEYWDVLAVVHEEEVCFLFCFGGQEVVDDDDGLVLDACVDEVDDTFVSG